MKSANNYFYHQPFKMPNLFVSLILPLKIDLKTFTNLTISPFSASQGAFQRPQYLTLLHVRLPPGFTSNASVLKPKQVHSAVYENGMFYTKNLSNFRSLTSKQVFT